MREMTGEERNQAAQRPPKSIVLGTFAIEAIGAAILASVYCFDLGYPSHASLAHAVFLSVSSFCNAGFSLHSDNLMLFAGNPLALFTIAGLITLGGLSFIVIIGVIQRLFSRRRIPLGCHERLVLTMTAILTLSGLVLFLLFDRHVGFQTGLRRCCLQCPVHVIQHSHGRLQLHQHERPDRRQRPSHHCSHVYRRAPAPLAAASRSPRSASYSYCCAPGWPANAMSSTPSAAFLPKSSCRPLPS